MSPKKSALQFRARPLRAKTTSEVQPWAFIVLPTEVSAVLPRRGRISVSAAVNGHTFTTQLEPDGQKSHWMRLDDDLLEGANAPIGSEATFSIAVLEQEPEPEVPADLAQALKAAPESRATWDATTTIARVDWIHWITSAKQVKTRAKRITDACEMLAEGKKRVCCFDPSGFYSKALRAPEVDDKAS